ncbi:MAG TPA: dipeptide/oligopeptide/nickel ABC transporter permease/ATP-binding protein [Caldilineaceae bacterium]|nr:dipeptide/oligopeptide/nickel ABC transporter permease/ATP-binding protein [Caldilineaceae bacterium]
MGRLWRALRSPRLTASLIVGLAVLAAVVAGSALGPLFVDTSKSQVGAVPPSLAPTAEYPLGTDSQGRDMLAVMVVATPQTLRMGMIAGLVGIGIGLLLGLLSGFFGGAPDTVIRVLADSLMTVPGIAILIIIASNVESMSVELMAITVASLAWMYPTRTIRAQVLSIRERAYTAVARANGQSELEVLFREIMPNLMPYIAASLVGAISGAILATVGLESLGLGAENVHTLGTTIYWARRYSAILRGQWWWWGPPIAIISLIFIGLFLVSVGLDRIANPTLAGLAPARRGRRQPQAKAAAGSVPAGAAPYISPVSNGGDGAEGGQAPSPILVVEDLRVVFETRAGEGAAVDGVSFRLAPGERMGLIGESGCGKTTLATALMAMTRPPGRIAGGRVLLEGRDLLALNEAELRRVRLSEIALVPQAAMNSLNPVMRIRDQIADAVLAHNKAVSPPELAALVEQALRQVGLPPSAANRFPHQLSGGMKQRAAMAIATVLRPKLIIADEPTSALDVVVQRQVMVTLGRVQKKLGAATILIGHDMGLVAQFSDSVGVLYAGKLVERGAVDDVLASPLHPYTRLLIDSLPNLETRASFVGIPGLPPALFDRPAGCRFHPRCPFAFDRCRQEEPALQALNGRQVACHLYPAHAALPALPGSAAVSHEQTASLAPVPAIAQTATAPTATTQTETTRAEGVDA